MFLTIGNNHGLLGLRVFSLRENSSSRITRTQPGRVPAHRTGDAGAASGPDLPIGPGPSPLESHLTFWTIGFDNSICSRLCTSRLTRVTTGLTGHGGRFQALPTGFN